MNACSTRPIRLMIADDHPLFLGGVRSLLDNCSDVEVVGEATSGARAARMISELQPELAVLDISMPDMNGIAVIRHLASNGNRTRIVILSAHEDRTFVREALSAGARGYVLKRSARENLVQSIRAVSGGGLYLDPAIAESVLPARDALARGDNTQAKKLTPSLTEREREVVRLIAFGYTNKEVAGKLGVTAKSVETYKTRASDKLDIRTRTKIVQYAQLQGWFYEVQA